MRSVHRVPPGSRHLHSHHHVKSLVEGEMHSSFISLSLPLSSLPSSLPSRVAVWMVSMAGERDSEILQLALPERLLPQEKQVSQEILLLTANDCSLADAVGKKRLHIGQWSVCSITCYQHKVFA